MSGGGGNSQTSASDLPAWMQPYAQSYLQKASAISDKPYEAYGGQTTASVDPRTQQGIDMQAQLGANGTTTGNAGAAALTDTLGGKWLGKDSNPYLTGQIDAAQGDVVRSYNTAIKPATETAMANSGSFGNSGLLQMQEIQQNDLQRNLAGISTTMRGNAYNTERANMQSAMSMAPTYNSMALGNAQAVQGAGIAQQGQQQMQLDDAYQRWMAAQNWDANQLNIAGNSLGTLRGSGQTGQTTQTGGGISKGAATLGGAATGAYIGSVVPGLGTAVGAAAGGALGYFSASDRRLKTDIKRVGRMDDGTKIYTYRYKAGGPMQMGVMAQDIEKTQPEAVARTPDGMRAVNYGLLGGK